MWLCKKCGNKTDFKRQGFAWYREEVKKHYTEYLDEDGDATDSDDGDTIDYGDCDMIDTEDMGEVCCLNCGEPAEDVDSDEWEQHGAKPKISQDKIRMIKDKLVRR